MRPILSLHPRSLLPLLPAAALALLAGCSSLPTKVDTGTIRANTFNFVHHRTGATPNQTDNRKAVHGMVQDAISQNLAARGVEKVAAGGDVTVAYLVIVGNRVSTASLKEYFSFGDQAYDLQELAHQKYIDSKNPERFEAGTLLVDIIDGKTFKLLKRSYVTRPVFRELSEEARSARIREAVDAVLADLKIAPR